MLKSKAFQRMFYGLLLGAVLLAGGGFYLHQSVRLPAEKRSVTDRAEPETPPATAAPALSDRIEFPRSLWASAGLQIRPVVRKPLVEPVNVTGKVALNEDRLAHIFPLVEGRVDEVRIQFGQRVRTGDLLVVVQSKEVGQGMLQLFQERLRLESAKLRDRWLQEVGQNTLSLIELMRSGASIETIEQALRDRVLGDYRERLMTAYISFLKAQTHFQRLSPLSESGAVAARQMLEAESEFNAARATLQSLWEQIPQDITQVSRLAAQTIQELETNIAVAETNLKILGFKDHELQTIDPTQQGEQLAHYPVTAPFDGTVISKDVVLLERVSPAQQTLTIADLSTVWVTADIYETHLPLLSQLKDQTIQFQCEAWPERTFEARVFYTGDVVHESTRTLTLRALADNPDGLLKPGMFVTVTLPGVPSEAVLQVPRSAVHVHAGASFVFVQTGEDTFASREVRLGRSTQEAFEVVSGLTEGAPVVVEGGFALKSKLLAGLLEE